MNNQLVSFKNVSKNYFLDGAQNKVLSVLKGINFELKKGDRVGLIGNNGAGKTTFFKLLAGISSPTSGKISRKGKIVTLMDLEDGFDLELSGRENILLNGLLIGMTRKEIKEKEESIIDFSGIRKFIDEPFFTYSSGMKFRLAFAIAIESKCDVLLMDEIFMSGDFEYQTKMFGEIKKYIENNHDMALVVSSHIPILLLEMINKCLEVKDNKLNKVDMNEFKNIAKTRNEQFYSMLGIDMNVDIKE